MGGLGGWEGVKRKPLTSEKDERVCGDGGRHHKGTRWGWKWGVCFIDVKWQGGFDEGNRPTPLKVRLGTDNK